MSTYFIQRETLTNIGNAIREKTGGTEEMTLAQMAEAISSLGGGGGDEASVLDSLIDGSITEITSNATSIRDRAMRDCAELTIANFPLVTSIGVSVFEGCKQLTTVDFPAVTSIGNYAFYTCESLTTVDFPLVTSIGVSAFANCKQLTTIILRSEIMCSLNSVNAFNNCYHFYGTVHEIYNPDGLKDGYIYVPKALIEDYKVATNWSTFATQFRALEDYTVDGTITGELDESKI